MKTFDPSPPTPLETTVQKETLDDLRNGVIPDRYELSGYLCKKEEKLIFSFKGVKHYCSAIHSEWTGRSAGASVRIVKGFWLRTGANKGHKVQHTSMDEQGNGTLVLTNQGISFVGAKSTRIPFSHILAFEPYTDGFSLDTDYARNNKHMFGNIHPENMTFLRSALEFLTGGGETTPSPQVAAPKVVDSKVVLPPPLPTNETAPTFELSPLSTSLPTEETAPVSNNFFKYSLISIGLLILFWVLFNHPWSSSTKEATKTAPVSVTSEPTPTPASMLSTSVVSKAISHQTPIVQVEQAEEAKKLEAKREATGDFSQAPGMTSEQKEAAAVRWAKKDAAQRIHGSTPYPQ